MGVSGSLGDFCERRIFDLGEFLLIMINNLQKIKVLLGSKINPSLFHFLPFDWPL